jgi:hypothetical protein
VVMPEHITELRLACSGEPAEMAEAGQVYIHLPGLKVPNSGQQDALLCLSAHSGYSTRLFLVQPVPGKGANWNQFHILGRTWYSWSWNNVSPDLRPMEVLAEHLRGLR